MKSIKLFILAAITAMCLTSCLDTPESPYVSFPSSTYSFNENDGTVSVPVKVYNSPYFFPLKATVLITSSEGLINIESTEITVEITSDNDTSIYFDVIDNDDLNPFLNTFDITIMSVEGADIGTINSTTVTIVDDEYAPRLYTGNYSVGYTNPFDTFLNEDGFTLTLRKVGKYGYVAYGWFGLDTPRLLGTFDPETSQITFTGSVYQLDESDNEDAFGTAYWFNDLDRTQALVFRGAGENGDGSIVLSTDNIDMDQQGSIKIALTGCGYDIYGCTVDSDGVVTVGEYIGPYGSMPSGAEFVYQSEDDDEDEETKSSLSAPIRIDHPVRVR